MKKNKLIIIAMLLGALILFTGCGKTSEESGILMKNISFRDIPGVTGEEIAAIEALQKQDRHFIYGMLNSTEAFINRDGEIRGYTALLCEWLSDVFGFTFKPEIFLWNELLAGLNSKEIDFAGNLTITEERRQTFFMTDAISLRSMKYIRLAGSEPISEISQKRPLRYALLAGSATAGNIINYAIEPFEPVYVPNYIDAYALLRNGEIDALIAESSAEAVFIDYEDIVTSDFLPLIFSPVSISTQNPDLAPVISVLRKLLESSGIHYVNVLYNQGYREYKRHKLLLRLTEEEIEFINNSPVIPFAAETTNFPASIFNIHEKEYQGISHDVLREIELLTGLEFKIVNEQNAQWPELVGLLEEGAALIISEMVRSPEREGRFLWPASSLVTGYSALISKEEHPPININEVYSVKVGLQTETVHTELFRMWFPEHKNTVETRDNLFDLLINDEVDMVMHSTIGLSRMSNYLELPGYKVNILFDNRLESTFGFNKDAEILCSIVDKALKLIDTNAISGRWLNKTFDYRIRLAKVEARIPWIISVAVVLALALVCLSILYLQNIRKRKIIAEHRERAVFLTNMSHEMRTPMNVIMGHTNLMLEEDNLVEKIKDDLKKVSIAGYSLLGLIDNVLDISKLETGKQLELLSVQYKLQHLLNDIITLNSMRIEEKPISFRLDINENLPYSLLGDDLRLKQIINNLLNNAFKFTEQGTIILGMNCIPCEGDSGNVWLEIYVSDTGIGIRRKEFKKLFIDYDQTGTTSSRINDSSGFGLTITRKLIEMMDGQFTVESKYGKGSIFRLRIKQGYVCDNTIGIKTMERLRDFRYAEDKRSKKLVRPDLSYAKVLVVDDMPTNLDVASSLLSKYKMQVDCVLSGQSAVDRMRGGESVYNAIFMDHMMPEMDGIETARAIRNIGTDYAKEIPIIALTANAIQGTEEMLYVNGFQGYLSKPVDLVQMDSIIRKWIMNKPENQGEV